MPEPPPSYLPKDLDSGHSTAQHRTAHSNPGSIAQPPEEIKARPSTAQRSTAQHGTAQHSTAKHSRMCTQ
ncbi:MAG: hypothetical protein FRX49_00100 [Trebouxia sp. A1-2]|nr:MAG: hypothetical protein FRX49_00100 [Trebouxia sp. A1-2]